MVAYGSTRGLFRRAGGNGIGQSLETQPQRIYLFIFIFYLKIGTKENITPINDIALQHNHRVMCCAVLLTIQ